MRAGSPGNRRGVLLVGGTHARELMNPDALVDLAVDLVASYLLGTDIVLGGRTWPPATSSSCWRRSICGWSRAATRTVGSA